MARGISVRSDPSFHPPKADFAQDDNQGQSVILRTASQVRRIWTKLHVILSPDVFRRGEESDQTEY